MLTFVGKWELWEKTTWKGKIGYYKDPWPDMEAEADESPLVWSTEHVSGQLRLCRETVSKKEKEKVIH